MRPTTRDLVGGRALAVRAVAALRQNHHPPRGVAVARGRRADARRARPARCADPGRRESPASAPASRPSRPSYEIGGPAPTDRRRSSATRRRWSGSDHAIDRRARAPERAVTRSPRPSGSRIIVSKNARDPGLLRSKCVASTNESAHSRSGLDSPISTAITAPSLWPQTTGRSQPQRLDDREGFRLPRDDESRCAVDRGGPIRRSRCGRGRRCDGWRRARRSADRRDRSRNPSRHGG